MSANVYTRIAEQYQLPASDEAIERFLLDVAPTLPREEREAIVTALQTDEIGGAPAYATADLPRDVPVFSIDEAPPVVRPNAIARLVGELAAAVETRVSQRLDTMLDRALDRLQQQTSLPSRHESSDAPARRDMRIADLVEGQTLTVIDSDCTVRAAAQRMAERNIGAVAVVNEGMLVGVFSERDLMVRVIAKGLDPDATSVAAVMSRRR